MKTGVWRKLLLAFGLTGALAACAGSSTGAADNGGLVDRLFGRGHLSGDENGATVLGMDSELSALPLAIAHCAHFHKSAELAAKTSGVYTFRCVAR